MSVILPYTTETYTHLRMEVDTHLHTPVCHRSSPGLPQTRTDITIKPSTAGHPSHRPRPQTNTHTTHRAVSQVSSCMLRGRCAYHPGSSTKHPDWAVKINFQPELCNSLHYAAPFEWISLRDKRTICFDISGFPLFSPSILNKRLE